MPVWGRALSAQVVTYNDHCYLMDCGEGTQQQMTRFKVKTHRLDAIFISHLHGDHIFGLPGLLSSMSMEGRKNTLTLYGPKGLKEWLDLSFACSHSYLTYPLAFVPTQDFADGDTIFSTNSVCVKIFSLKHRMYCRGFRWEEINKKPKFDFYKAKALDIPNAFFHLLKLGNTITLEDGRTIHPEQVHNPPDAPLSYAYCSDTSFHTEIIPHIQNTTLLYHEATFTQDLQKRANETGHSTAADAARIAQMANAKKLLLGHFSARYKELFGMLSEAQSIFPPTEIATDGTVYTLTHSS